MENRNGLDYLQLGIDDSGVINLDQLGFDRSKPTPGNNILEISRRNRNYNPNIGDITKPSYDLQGLSNLREMSPEELQQALYDTQTGVEMAANALKGMAAIAGTTYLSNTVGLGNILLEGTWDNTVNNYMAELENQARENNQIYRPTDYDKWSLGKKLGSGVFWADLIQNLGFTIGAGAAAMTFNAIPGVGTALAAAPKIIQMAAPSLIGAIGEASIEAIHHKNQETQDKTNKAISRYNEMINRALTPKAVEQLSQELGDALYTIEEDERKAGNYVFGMNIGALTLSNAIQFGDFFARGFSSGRRVANATKKAVEASSSPITQLEKASVAGAAALGTAKGLLNSASESIEEMTQSAISTAASLNSDYDSFNESKFNTDKKEQVSGMLQSLVRGYAEILNDPNTATEAAMGFITGAIGMPRLKKSIVPVGLEGGIFGEVRDDIREAKDFNKTIDIINARLADNKGLNAYYEGLTRHLVFQDKEDTALENNDHKAFADANSAKFISDIMMFDKVGRLDMLDNIIDTANTLSNEDIASLIQETTTNGNGPFSTNGNAMSVEEIKTILQEKAKVLKDKVIQYKSVKDNLLSEYPTLNEDSLEEALFYKMSIHDLNRRITDIGKKIYKAIKDIASIEPTLKTKDQVGLNEALAYITEANIIKNLQNRDSELFKAYDKAIVNNNYKVPVDTINTIASLNSDAQKIEMSLEKYLDNYNSVLQNPTAANQRNNKTKAEIANKEQNKQQEKAKKAVINNIKTSDTSSLVNQSLDGDLDFSGIDSSIYDALDDFTKNKLKQASGIVDTYQKAISDGGTIDAVDDIPVQVQEDAKALMTYVTKNATSLDDILDPHTYQNLDHSQIQEAFADGDLSDEEAVIAQNYERLSAAVKVLDKVLPQLQSDEEEKLQMAISNPDTIKENPEVGRDSVSTAASVSNEGATFKKEETQSQTSKDEIKSTGWTSGYSYMYTGSELEYKGKTYMQYLTAEIDRLEKKAKDRTITSDEEIILPKLKRSKNIIDYLNTEQNIYSKEKQIHAQIGDKVYFIVDPNISQDDVLMATKGANNTYNIVGIMAPYNAAGVLERYKNKGNNSFYVDSATSIITDKKVGVLPKTDGNRSLNSIFTTEEGFTLAVDLADKNTDASDIRILPNSQKDTPKTDEERGIRPPYECNPGAVYVLVPTSDTKNTTHVVARVVADVYDSSNSNSVNSFLEKLNTSSAPLEKKLEYLQAVLDVDLFLENTSITADGEGRNTKVTYTVTSKGTYERGDSKTRFGKVTGAPEEIISAVLKLIDKKVRYTVDRHYINTDFSPSGEDYNTLIGEVLTANLETNPSTVGDWFYIKPISRDGNIVVGTNTKAIKPTKKNAETISKIGDVTTITIDAHTLEINSSTWEVKRDGVTLSPDKYKDNTYKWLAETFLSNNGITKGIRATPWGYYDLSKREMVGKASPADMQKIGPLLSLVTSDNIKDKVKALAEFYALDFKDQTPALETIFDEANTLLYNQGITYESIDKVIELWNTGSRDNITIANIVNDSSLPEGTEKIVEVVGTIIHNNVSDSNPVGDVLHKAEVIIARNQASIASDTINSTAPSEELEWLAQPAWKEIYQTLNSESQELVKTKVYKLPIQARERYLRTLMDKLKSQSIENRNAAILGTPKARTVESGIYQPLDFTKETKWLSKVLPQLSTEDRFRVVEGFTNIAKSTNSDKLWGLFKNGVMYISQNAAEGTVYHEAFHAVVETLLTTKEKQSLFKEAKKQYGSYSEYALEELMAEDFRRYVTYDISTSNSAVKKLWKKLSDLIRYIFNSIPQVEKVFYRINTGIYADRILNKTKESTNAFDSATTATIENALLELNQNNIIEAGITEAQYSALSTAEKQTLFECMGI